MKFGFPPTGAEPELRSLVYQASRIKPVPVVDENRLKSSIDQVVTFSNPTSVPNGLEKSDGVVSRGQIISAVDSLKNDGSPGYPFVYTHASKGELKDPINREELIEAVITRLSMLAGFTLKEVEDMTPVDLVRNGLVDLVKIFVKQDPHSSQKLADGRYRLIASRSVTDEVCERLLTTPQNESDKLGCMSENGTASGCDFVSDEGAKKLYDVMRPRNADSDDLKFSSDIKAWDFSMKRWLFQAELEVRKKLNGASDDSAWWDLIQKMKICLMRSVFALSDGRLFVIKTEGVQKSGGFDTTPGNTRKRNLAAVYVGSKKSKSMGDDNDSSVPKIDGRYATKEEITKLYADIGLEITDINMNPTEFDFCSHVFKDGVAYPTSLGKGLYNLLQKNHEITPELLHTFYTEYRHSEKIGLVRGFLEARGYHL